MRKYDAVFIYPTDKDKMSACTEQIKAEFEKAGISIANEEDMGERRLAYPVKKHDRGHYFRYDIEAEPDTLKPLDKTLRLKSEILKYVFFKKEK